MSNLYFIAKSYSPYSAATNRIIGWARGLSDIGVKATFVFFTPGDNFATYRQELPNVTFKYYWRKHKRLQKVFPALFSLISLLSFILKVKEDDQLYFYGCPDVVSVAKRFTKAKIYVEITEHPKVSFVHGRYGVKSFDEFLEVLKKVDGLFVISKNLKQYFISQNIKSDKIHILNMTVDGSRFNNLKKNGKQCYIVYCGSPSNQKDGVDQLIKAFAIVAQTHCDVKLWIVGPLTNEQSLITNKNLISELGLTNKVELTGAIVTENIPQILKNAEVCVLARPDNLQAKYGFPTKLGEYLLSENPVVVTRVGNIPDFLQDGFSALIAEPDNIVSIASKISWCLDYPNEAKEIGRNGAMVANKYFNYKVETYKIIKEIGLQ